MHKALLYKKLSNKKAQCLNCAHKCIIRNKEKGICRVRENRDGELYSLVYNTPCAINIDPIEKKPFYHFLPGTYSLSIATVGCNFACYNCQNWQISQYPKITGKIKGGKVSPQKIIDMAIENNLPSISYTYTEPAIFSEYALDIMKLAKKQGIKNCWVSNGFWSKELFELIFPYLDAANIDLKSFDDKFYRKYCGAELQPVLDTLQRIKKKNIWLEVTTLIIPTLNDTKDIFAKIAKFIRDKLGQETPWHISRFSGALSWKLRHIQETPVETMEKAYDIAQKAGLKNVYLGNI